MVESTDFARVIAEALDIAGSVKQRPTTAHVLLSMFTIENRAAKLLTERGIDEDRLLELLSSVPTEPEGLLKGLRTRARDIAQSCDRHEVECLHALIAMTRVRCSAQDLLLKTGLDLTALRNTALGYYSSGRMPRRLMLQDELPAPRGGPRPVGAPPRRATRQTNVVTKTPAPVLSVRDLVEASTDDDPALNLDEVTRESEATASAASAAKSPTTRAAPAAATKVRPQSSFELESLTYPLLTSIGRNLTALAREGKLDPVVGRAKEIDELIDVLGKRRTNNPVLVGEPGVGKTAVVEGAAQQMLVLHQGGAVRHIVEVDMASLVAGTQLRGSFSERLNALKSEMKRAQGNVVVFIDEIHTLIGAGSTGEGPQDAANELKAAMSRGEFPCIGATTHDEYRKHLASDSALERRFTPIVVNEPSVADAVYIINGVISRYAQHHALTYAPEALQAAATLSHKYIKDRHLPDSAISVLDLTGSRARREGKSHVEAHDVARVVARLAGIPEVRLLTEDSEKLLSIQERLKERIIGHDATIERIAQVIRRNYAGFASGRPMGSFLFLGPTGVGKTETARALADVVFGTRDAMIRLDMSEMSEGHSVSRLIGAPAGYVGYGDGGQLCEPVRRRPSSVVVLDEIDKAHQDVLMLLLQILEEGCLTDSRGRKVDFANTIIILTTNLGTDELVRGGARQVGFGGASHSPARTAAADAARKRLPPELWNRLDERCTFEPLKPEDVTRIASLLLEQSSDRLLRERGIRFSAEPGVVHHLVEHGGFDVALGARPMRQTVQRLVEGPIAERILGGDFVQGDNLRIDLADGDLSFAVAE